MPRICTITTNEMGGYSWHKPNKTDMNANCCIMAAVMGRSISDDELKELKTQKKINEKELQAIRSFDIGLGTNLDLEIIQKLEIVNQKCIDLL